MICHVKLKIFSLGDFVATAKQELGSPVGTVQAVAVPPIIKKVLNTLQLGRPVVA